MVSKARTDTSVRRRCTQRKHHNTARGTHKNRGTTPKSHGPKHTRDSVFNRLELTVVDPNLDDEYDSEHERSAGSRENADLRARLDTQRAQREQQAENKPPVQATSEKERLSQIQAQIDRLLAERSIPDPVSEVLSETRSHFSTNISTTIPPKNFKMPTIPLCDGKTDPIAHVHTYRAWMNIAKADVPTLCNVFPLTLSGPAQAWFGKFAQGRLPALTSSRSSLSPSF